MALIHKSGYSIKQASNALDVPYANAKAINQIYLRENRTAKKKIRFKNQDSDLEKKYMA